MPVPIYLRQYLIDWPLSDNKNIKSYFETTHRICAPQLTFEKFAPLRAQAGITRLSEITDLDFIGIPTFAAFRPAADLHDGNVTVYNGKGLTKIQAKVSALMEAFESYAGERHDRPTILESLNEIDRYGIAVDPRELILPEGEYYEPSERIEWICGRDLISGKVHFIPAQAAFFPYHSRNAGRYFSGFSDSNGLASGNTFSEAISHALAEVIERDAATIAEMSATATTVDLTTIDSPLIQSLLEQYKQCGINIVVKAITSKLNIPSFFAVSDDPITEDPCLLCFGFGTHVNAEIAVMRAVTEAAQSRCTIISGSREDLSRDAYKRSLSYYELKNEMRFWYDEKPPFMDFRQIKIRTNNKISDDIQMMVSQLKKCKFGSVIVVNLSSGLGLDVPVVRVIVPGLEAPLESTRRGPRAFRFKQ